jgi:hypothetical protein
LFVVPEVLSVQDIPSEEVRMLPTFPTVTNNPFAELGKSSSSLLLQEMTARLKMNTERIMKIYLT